MWIKKTASLLFFTFFIAVMLIPLALSDTEEGLVSDVDGRTVPARPSFGTDNYPSELEAWLRDRLGLRDEIIHVYETANTRFFDELINPVYQYGKEGHVFFRIHSNIEYSDYHMLFAEMVSEMQKYCESRGTKFYYVFNPEKESVYAGYLPAGVNYNDEWADRMLTDMDRLGVNCIDLRDSFKTIDSDAEVFNRKYDAGHWNQEGSFYGMKAITDVIHRDIPEVKPLEKDEYEITTVVAEKIYGSDMEFNEEVPEYILKTKCREATGDFASELARNSEYTHFRLIQNDSENAAGIKRLLLFEDDLYAQFAVTRSKETAIVTCLQNAVNFDYYYNIFKPDVVIFENMEYVVQDKYFSQAAMKAAERNPAILENYPEKDFQERRDRLLDQTVEGHVDASAVLIPGNSIDRVYLSKELEAARYAYLITDNKVLDLKRNLHGALATSVMHGDLSAGSDVILFIRKENGDCRYAVIPVQNERKIISKRMSSSDNARYEKRKKQYVMSNKVEGDAFTYASIQLYDEDISTWFETIDSISEAGIVDGSYCHKMPTGTYTLLLRAGSNITSEWKAFNVLLVEGHSYWFSYKVDEFSDDKVVFSSFEFSKERKQ